MAAGSTGSIARTVFTSLDHAQIVADGNRRGVRVLKEFLEYAAHGTVTPRRRTGGEPENDFERWFLSRLKSAGTRRIRKSRSRPAFANAIKVPVQGVLAVAVSGSTSRGVGAGGD